MEENIKVCWKRTRFSNILEPGTPGDGKRRTALERLAAQYQRFSRLALVLAMTMPMWVWGAVRGLENVPLWGKVALLWYGILYCLTAAAMDGWLYRGIRRIDVAEMPVAEVCRMAYFYRKRHLQFVAVLVPMAAVFVGAFVWMVSDSVYTLYGVATGAVIGLALGLRALRNFMHEYRQLGEHTELS